MDDPIAAFAEEARRYCAFIESDSTDNSWVFARQCLSFVLTLFEKVMLLPTAEPDATELLVGIEHELWQAQFERLGRKLSRDYYWGVFEPLEKEPPEPVCGSVSDDLADIWRDLKSGIIGIDSGKATIDDAVWHWRFSFESHWAHHAAGAITALTALCFGQFADVSRPQDSHDGR